MRLAALDLGSNSFHALIADVGVPVYHAAPRADRVDPRGARTPRPRGEYRYGREKRRDVSSSGYWCSSKITLG